MNRFLDSQIAKSTALTGSLTTIGVFLLPFEDKAAKFIAVGIFISLLFAEEGRPEG